jgi:hypothetical protein
MSYWKTSVSLSDDLFVFSAPVTAQQIEMLPADAKRGDIQ